LLNVSGWLYIEGMEKHEVVNQIIDYLEVRRSELEDQMVVTPFLSNDYVELEAMHEVYDHLITKLEDDFR
jgi:hypothetical protein